MPKFLTSGFNKIKMNDINIETLIIRKKTKPIDLLYIFLPFSLKILVSSASWATTAIKLDVENTTLITIKSEELRNFL